MKTESHLHINKYAANMFDQTGRWPGGQSIVGFILEEGDVLLETDVYDSTSGAWEPCPCPGLKLMTGAGATWVRPDNS